MSWTRLKLSKTFTQSPAVFAPFSRNFGLSRYISPSFLKITLFSKKWTACCHFHVAMKTNLSANQNATTLQITDLILLNNFPVFIFGVTLLGRGFSPLKREEISQYIKEYQGISRNISFSSRRGKKPLPSRVIRCRFVFEILLHIVKA